jgi:NADPH-dependent 2,4-dienoyl-CoA reductase/sulfur reductase-like enzyme
MDEHISYSGCGLPYYIGGKVADLKTLTPRDPAFFRAIRCGGEDPPSGDERRSSSKTLLVRNLVDQTEFEDHYDTLILSTGATSIVPPIPGVDSPHVFT